MNKTLETYSKTYKSYIDKIINADMSFHYNIFKKYLNPNDIILDLGCGSGRDTKYFNESGFQVVSIDGC